MQATCASSNRTLSSSFCRHRCQVASVPRRQLLHTQVPRHNAVRVAAAQADQAKPAPKRVFRKKGQTEHPHTILAIDGGGMRGMIPACVLEQIEQSIKEGALELLKKDRKRFAEVLSFEPGSFNQDMPTPDEISKLTVADIKVDLADFFDLLSGTSTGSILAAFLATKGGACEEAFLNPSDAQLKDRYIDSLKQFKTAKGKEHSTYISPGSAEATQALFAAVGGEIFTKFGGWLNPANWPLNPLKDVTATAERLAWKRLYGDEGIERVLKDILRKPGGSRTDTTTGDHFIQLKDDDHLYTSLLIPSFQIDHNRPVMFWHLHRPDSVWGSSWGYSTLHRLKPFEGLEEMSVMNTAIIDAVAKSMAELLSDKLEISLEPERIKRAPELPENDPIFEPCAEEIAEDVARAVYTALKAPPGFTQEGLQAVIVGALRLLQIAVRADPETRRKIPLVDNTFEDALSAMIIPALRPDMLTTMYVLDPKSKPEPEAVETTSWLSGGIATAAQGAGTLASEGYKAVKSAASAAGAALRAPAAMLRGSNQPLGGPGGGLDYQGSDEGPDFEPYSFNAEPAPTSGNELQRDWERLRLWAENQGLLTARQRDAVQEACRFYEAQSGDSLHVYDVNFNLWEVVRASTAAPTFFEAPFLTSLGVGKPSTPIVLDKRYQQLLQGRFADGGVVANNPTLAAIAFLERAYGVERQNMAVLSVGCGSVTGALSVNPNAGGRGWVGPLLSQVFMGSSIDTVTAVAEMVFTADGNPDKALPCGQSPPCVKAVEAQSKNKQGASRYLRIQVVGFAPSEMGWLDRMRVRLGLKEEAPKLRIVTPTPTKAQKPTSRAAQVRREVNYLAIDPTLSAAPVDTSKKFSNVELRDALTEMDRAQDWEKLLVIGGAVSQHFSEDIRAWVDQHILLNRGRPGPTPSASHGPTPEPGPATPSATVEQ